MNSRSRLRPRATGLGGLLTMCLLMVIASGAFGATRAAHDPRPVQRLVQLQRDHRVHSAPRAGAPITEELAAQRPITGERTEVPLLAQAVGPEGTSWLQVLLPGRPNGARGWIARQGTRSLSTSWALTVDLGTRTVRVYRTGRLLRSFRAVVGKPSTPTPTGSFFVEETLQMYSGELGGPYALALSARSNALQEFEGGPGQIALHGRDGLGGTLGQAESHGCMRLATAGIDWLAARIGPGTPVRIYAG